jgi:WD40 repeat protein
MWDLRKVSKPLHTLSGHLDWVKSIHVDTVRDRLVSCSYDGTLRLWVPSTAECASVLSGHNGTVNSFDYAYPVIASAGGDGTVRIWNVEKGTCKTLRGHASEVTRVRFIDENQVASASYDKTLRIWSTNQNTPCLVLRGHSDWITTLQKASKRLVTGSLDCTIKIWTLHDEQLQAVVPDSKKKAKKAAVTTKGKKK